MKYSFKKTENTSVELQTLGQIEDKIFVYEDKVCPLCGNRIWSYNNPDDDNTLGDYCVNQDCEWFSNQFLSYEDLIVCEK